MSINRTAEAEQVLSRIKKIVAGFEGIDATKTTANAAIKELQDGKNLSQQEKTSEIEKVRSEALASIGALRDPIEQDIATLDEEIAKIEGGFDFRDADLQNAINFINSTRDVALPDCALWSIYERFRTNIVALKIIAPMIKRKAIESEMRAAIIEMDGFKPRSVLDELLLCSGKNLNDMVAEKAKDIVRKYVARLGDEV